MTIDSATLQLILGVSGGLVGVIALILTLLLYLASNRTQVEVMKLVAEVKTSAGKIEVTSGEQFGKTLEALIEKGRAVPAALDVEQSIVKGRIDSLLREEIGDALAKDKLDVLVQRVQTELRRGFGAARYEATKAIEPDVAPERTLRRIDDYTPPAVARLVSWMHDNRGTFSFFGLKLVHEKIFQRDPAIASAIDFCVKNGLIFTRKRANPFRPKFPTTEIVLNYDHPLIREITGSNSTRSRPMLERRPGEGDSTKKGT